jgi:hypothetical protein
MFYTRNEPDYSRCHDNVQKTTYVEDDGVEESTVEEGVSEEGDAGEDDVEEDDVEESELLLMICVNIWSAACPVLSVPTSSHQFSRPHNHIRARVPVEYAGTSCPAPLTRTYENMPAFLYTPASWPATVHVANSCC